VSLHIKRLEEELGCPLFLRTKRRVYLNDSGRLLLQYADRIFQELKNAEMAVRELEEMERGIIRLGSGATTLTYLLPKILAAHQRRFPDIELIVTTDSSESLAQGVHAQKLDLAVVMQPVQPSLSIEILPIFREELVFVLSASHRLADKDVILPEDIPTVPFISFLKGSAMQTALDRQFLALGVSPRVTMEMENIEAIKSLVHAGLGLAVLPECSVAGAHGSGLRVMRVPGAAMTRNLALALPRANTLPRAIQKFASRLTKGLCGKNVTEIRAELAGEISAR
jgi:LysR family cyn operon transcriptional activator